MHYLDFEFDLQVERASTLPARCYTEAEVLSLESQRIFHRTWQLVGRLDQLPEPGSYFAAEIAGDPIVILRDSQGGLRGFHNVCRHRAGPVVQGTGCRRTLQCGYHGWTYGLDGRLLGAPDMEGTEDFRPGDFHLIPVGVETWGSFIFVKIDQAAPGRLSDFFGELTESIAPDRVSQMRFAARREYLIECDWKVYVDNYLEGYHVPIIHPSLMREIDYQRYRTVTHRYHSRQDAPIRGGSGEGRRYSPSAAQSEALYFWVFPNLMLNVYPDNLSTNLILPLGPGRTLTVFDWYFHSAESTPGEVEGTIRLSDEIQQEDIAICEAVQRGLRSTSYDRGRYCARRENGVHHFHSLWREFMAPGARRM